ncbi:hypothetical protein C453_19150 [Haloferax elongans ATCC BAA-1513]|uniref:Uncharacterized protein n=1 Tax=Haloferax elongans ATCC BAA-1513 TaxID=1230453 RepID=M0H6S2_HALEO|nr:hypothetical protein [Haloferax elongans]ELZ80226.1 hypothetical protein C453_19150 [Haloferax elongans ATCC BAA-1513]
MTFCLSVTNNSHLSATRRGVLAALGTVSVAGCSELVARDTPYQIVGGVESTLIRGIRDGTNRKVAETTPTNSSVVDSAPTELGLRTVAYDTAVVDLSGDGRMGLDSETTERIRDGYDDPYGVIVLTLYNDDSHNEVPKGNSYGYRTTLEQLGQVAPGNRVSATVDTDRDVIAIDELLSVDSVSE